MSETLSLLVIYQLQWVGIAHEGKTDLCIKLVNEKSGR